MAVGVALILLSLSLLHFVWGLRGEASQLEATVPHANGKPLFVPSRSSCLVVAAGLLAAAWLVAGRGGVVGSPLPPPWGHYGCLAVGGVFVLRGVGDFRLVGLFKRASDSTFARWDTRLYTPLCFAIGLGALRVALAS